MWSLFSMIAELPPLIRNSKKNILVHSIWTGSLDFNSILSIFNSEINILIENGIELKNKMRLSVRLIGLISDSVARPKICYSTQFNGHFGCLHCLHPNGSNPKCEKKTIYNYIPNIIERSKESYERAVQKAVSSKQRFQGIKGYAYVTKWLDIPSNIILDYMHLSLEGMTNWFLSTWLSDSNKSYYLGNREIFLYTNG